MKRFNSETVQPAKKQKNTNDANDGMRDTQLSAIPSPAEIQKRLEAAKAQVQQSLSSKAEQVMYFI